MWRFNSKAEITPRYFAPLGYGSSRRWPWSTELCKGHQVTTVEGPRSKVQQDAQRAATCPWSSQKRNSTCIESTSLGKKQGGPENPKARRHTAHLLTKILWCGQLFSARNGRTIFILRHRARILLTLSHLSSRYSCLDSSLVCFAAGGEDEAWTAVRNENETTASTAWLEKTAGRSWPKEHENQMKMTNRWWTIMENATWWKMWKDFSV